MGGSMSAGACGDCVHCRLREGSGAMAAPCEVLRTLGMQSIYVEVDAKFTMNGKEYKILIGPESYHTYLPGSKKLIRYLKDHRKQKSAPTA